MHTGVHTHMHTHTHTHTHNVFVVCDYTVLVIIGGNTLKMIVAVSLTNEGFQLSSVL